jgi:predicted metal-dependent phosphoesterase TrpH
VIAAAATAGLEVVALTDHDTTAGWAEASAEARRRGITLIPGAEISCQVDGIGVHMLAYLHDPDDPDLRTEMSRTRDDRVHRARRIVERLARDVPLTYADVLKHVDGRATVGRPHIADALVANGVVADRDEAFATLLNSRSPYYLPHYAPRASQVATLVRTAGGVPVIAHCRARHRGRVIADDDIADLVDAGMLGIEVDHRDHTDVDRAQLRRLADELDLLVTGSSDYHGAGKLNRIGENTTAPRMLERLIESGTPQRVVKP